MVKIYGNRDVEEIVVAIPRGHKHVRMLIRFNDQEIVLNEATIAAIARSYLSIILHPQRRGLVLRKHKFNRGEVKEGYDEYQLIEVEGSEDYAVDVITRVLMESR